MSVVFSYSLAVSVTLLLGFCAYRLSPENRIRFSFRRITLIAIFSMSLMLPLLPSMRSGGVTAVDPITIEPSMIQVSQAVGQSGRGSDIWRILLLVWGAGTAVALLFCVVSLLRIFVIIIRAECRNISGRNVYITGDKRIAPFSLGNKIVVNRCDLESNANIILSHEAGHVCHCHTLDMFLSQVIVTICWYNPAAWMLRKELKAVHEFQADRYVIDHGNDSREYQLFLVMKAARTTFPSIGHNLNKSRLKSRIRAMNSASSLIPFSIIGLAATAAAFVAAFLLLSAPAVSATLRQSAATQLITPSVEPVNDFNDIKVIGVSTVKKFSRDSLNTINPDSIESITVYRKTGKSDIVLKDKTVMQIDTREMQKQNNDAMMVNTVPEEQDAMNVHILSAKSVKKDESAVPVVHVGKKELDDVRIFIDGVEVSSEAFSALSASRIESLAVDKSGDKPCIRVTLKKNHE